ncbi:MAG TPA: acetoin utilization protein AcuC [Longimicrobiales bacterium]|nr:acetoin utilization protein AcuC [Longimicrobiales bacterium]
MVTALVWTDALAGYRFRPGHPLNPRRLELTAALIRAMELAGGPDRPIVEPREATDEELLTVHDPAYVDAVRAVSAHPRTRVDPRFGLGTDDVPVVARMHEMARHAVGATLTAAELVASGRATRAYTLAGGLHHAHAAAASGFCVYNDLAVAIRWLQRAHGMRVLYVDYDAHHGDGVQALFYDDPDVLTVSLHESGLYLFPASGFVDELGEGDGYGYSANVPLEAQTEDASFLAAFDAVVPALADAFRPDILVVQTGCDAHAADPLTHLRCSTGLFETLAERVVAIAERHCGGRLVATGGGGYAIHEVVPRAWTLTWAALCGEPAPDRIPDGWLRDVRAETAAPPPPTLRDPPGSIPPSPRREEIERANDLTVRALRQRILPLITGWGLGF